MSWPHSHLLHPKSTWSPSILGFLIYLRVYWTIDSGQICTSSLFAFSKKKHHWMEYYSGFLWFDWRNFQYFANDSYFLQWKRLEFIYWEPYQIRCWTSLHSIWHCIHSSALCFLQTKSSFKNSYVNLNLYFLLNNKLIKESSKWNKNYLRLQDKRPETDIEIDNLSIKVSKTRKQIVKPWIRPKNKPMNSTCFCSFFGRNWRHQKTFRN